MATEHAGIPSAHKRVITNLTRQKIDIAKALKLRLMGNTFEEIGKVFDCSPQAVYQALDKFKDFTDKADGGSLPAYSEHRAELFNAVEFHLASSLLDADALQKASLNNRAYALKVVHEARRLESGQSTGNISVLATLIIKAEDGLGKPAPVSMRKDKDKSD